MWCAIAWRRRRFRTGRDCEEWVAREEKVVVWGKAWRLWRRMKCRERRVLCWGS
jgi:hypothetical protein